ncbi:MAG: hypothetical protein ACI4EK_04060 [Wujia sp.]
MKKSKPKMNDRKDTKKTEKTEDKSNKDKNILINGICLLLGVLILVLGITAPKTIMAMMDKGELNKLYVRDIDTDLEAENEPLSVEEKLELMCDGDINVSISTSGQQSEDRAFDKKIAKMAQKEIKLLQEKNIIPQIDIGEYSEEAGGYYRNYNGNEKYYSYSCEYFSVVSLDNMNRYVSVAMLLYNMDDEYLAVVMDTDTGKIYEFLIETYVSEKELDVYTQEDLETAVWEYLGMSKNEFASYYYVNMGQAMNIEADVSSDGEYAYLSMSLGLKKSEQIRNSFGY